MILFIFIYVLGFISTYYFAKSILKKEWGGWDWEYIFVTLITCLVVWYLAIILLLIKKLIIILENTKPPKWL